MMFTAPELQSGNGAVYTLFVTILKPDELLLCAVANRYEISATVPNRACAS